jgi:hypothetical protein
VIFDVPFEANVTLNRRRETQAAVVVNLQTTQQTQKALTDSLKLRRSELASSLGYDVTPAPPASSKSSAPPTGPIIGAIVGVIVLIVVIVVIVKFRGKTVSSNTKSKLRHTPLEASSTPVSPRPRIDSGAAPPPPSLASKPKIPALHKSQDNLLNDYDELSTTAPSPISSQPIFMALYRFEPADHTQIALCEGDQVVVLLEATPEWWHVRLVGTEKYAAFIFVRY